MNAASTVITSISGRAVPVRGNDIDTDRIIPARYLRAVTFEGLGEHAFEDDRRGLKAKGQVHSFDEPRFQGGSILFVNKNFGCGSSREHAPQSLMRWGIKAVVGESFAEIFFGNCVALGMPCVTVSEVAINQLLNHAENDPSIMWELDLETNEIRRDGKLQISSDPTGRSAGLAQQEVWSIPIFMPEGARSQFLSGQWNPMNELLSHLPEVDSVAANLPYVSGRW